ncbi:MAG: T9SS type A sorting domain-containing protein [Candidatus Paceibacterota bacterium]
MILRSIRFALPSSEFARLKVFDLLGREIARLAEGQFEAGLHEVQFNAHQLSSGTYFYSLEAGAHREIKKMVLMK